MKRKQWVLVAVAIVIAAGLGLRWSFTRKNGPTFRSVTVSRGDLHLTVLATGTVQPQNRLELKPPIAGRVEEILVEEGQSVHKGETLALLSSTDRAALLDAARAKGPEEMAHWEEVYKPTPLISPIDGAVIVRNVEPGQSVTASDAVLVLSDHLIVRTDVDETDIGQLQLDQHATITLDAYPDDVIAGRVDHIAYEAKTVNNVTIYEVDVLPARVPPFMRSGMTANVTFITAEKQNALLVPSEAVHQGKHGTMVLLQGASKKPQRQQVETGLTDGKNTEILSGLDEGQTVLIPTIRLPSGSAPSGRSPFSPFGARRQQGGRSSR